MHVEEITNPWPGLPGLTSPKRFSSCHAPDRVPSALRLNNHPRCRKCIAWTEVLGTPLPRLSLAPTRTRPHLEGQASLAARRVEQARLLERLQAHLLALWQALAHAHVEDHEIWQPRPHACMPEWLGVSMRSDSPTGCALHSGAVSELLHGRGAFDPARRPRTTRDLKPRPSPVPRPRPWIQAARQP